MKVRGSAVVILSVCGMILGGCVTSGTYEAKEQESQQLSKSLENTKSSYTELKDKFTRLEEANNEQQAKLGKVSAEAAEMKLENARLVDLSGEQGTQLKKLAAEAAEMKEEIAKLGVTNRELAAKLKQTLPELAALKRENAKLAEANGKQSDKLRMISAEFVEMKLENSRLVDAVKPENILKTLAETLKAQQQQVVEMKAENIKMKQDLLHRKLQQPESSAVAAPVAREQPPASPPQEMNKELPIEPVESAPVRIIEPETVVESGDSRPELTSAPVEMAPVEKKDSPPDMIGK